MSPTATPTKTTTIGPLLDYALTQLEQAKGSERMVHMATRVNGEVIDDQNVLLPVVLKLETKKPQSGESWEQYKARIMEHLFPVGRMVRETMGLVPTFLITANSIKLKGTPEQIRFLEEQEQIQKMELDPLLQVVTMDDAVKDIGLPEWQQRHRDWDGTGVTVAVLDSGIDTQHPFLQVHQSVSTCGESTDLPGSHGTHCAGIIASKDAFYPGVAPGVQLLNIKVLQSDGRGEHTSISQGIDAALDLGAEVLSLSLGFNHLPPWSLGGHGWECTGGHCPLCTAVDNAVSFDNVIVVVAAGNEHERAESLRANGFTGKFDTEISCPGQAREAITVGAITKQTFIPASFSSHGPTAFGTVKPDICAPGVNITSTAPVPREANGVLVASPSRPTLFARKSGTSMATPMVAGMVALIIQKFKQNGVPITPSSVKNELYYNGISALAGVPDQLVGRGRISLGNI